MLKVPIKIIKQSEIIDYQSLITCHSSIIELNQIEFGQEIGTGEFGAVYKGKYKNSDVAIKTIKDPTTIKEFFKEAAVMALVLIS